MACEDTRRTGRLLSHAGISGPKLMSVRDANEAARAREIVGLLRAGKDVALVSDAGNPAVSDPGLQGGCRGDGPLLEVTAIPGPSAALTALVTSGLPTARFVFEGFLPRKGSERKRRLAALAAESRTIVLFEAPHRLLMPPSPISTPPAGETGWSPSLASSPSCTRKPGADSCATR